MYEGVLVSQNLFYTSINDVDEDKNAGGLKY